MLVLLCNFEVYNGRTTDPVSWEKVSEKGLTMRVISNLVSPFDRDVHHSKIFVVGTIKWTAPRLPPLKGVKP